MRENNKLYIDLKMSVFARFVSDVKDLLIVISVKSLPRTRTGDGAIAY